MNEGNIPAATETPNTPVDDPIERNIALALEAQDGPSEPNTETPSGNEAKQEDSSTPKPKDSVGDGSDGQSQQPPKQEGTKEEKPTHSPKDLTLADGTVVKGGPERRFYEQREVARQQLEVANRNLQSVTTRAEKAENDLRTLQETTRNLHGVDPETLRVGARIVTDLQRDPVGTMQKLLAETIAQGYKIEGITNGLDTAAITRLIEERMPQQQQPEQSDAEILAEAQQEVTNFYMSHPDARPHDALLGRILRDNPGLDLQTAYFEIKNAFIEKGYDFSLTLEDNLKASQSSQETPQSPTAPMVNGRTPVGSDFKSSDEVKIAHEDTDMGDIVKQAMRESGLNV
jgi:hypothetical protein